MQLPLLGVCNGVQNKGCRVIVHTCRFKVSPKNDDFLFTFMNFGLHYYNSDKTCEIELAFNVMTKQIIAINLLKRL